MTTLTISEQKARKLFPTASKEFKAMLEDSFGEKFFSADICDRITSFEQVCKEAGENPTEYIIPNNATPRQRGTILFNQLQLICEVFREGVVLDYANENQAKYYPWGRYKPGSGFSLSVVSCDGTGSAVGARLSVDTDKKARHIWECFSNIIIAYWEGQ